MITLGDCSDCGNCVGSLCDRIVFLKGATAEPTDLGQYKYWNEGATVTVNVARIPDCFGWDGTPDEYNTANGSYPPVGVDGYFYDYGARNFWKNITGTFTADAGPAEYGTGAVSVSWAVTREECGCNHMWAADSGTLTWTAGDIADKTITLTTPAHAGTVPFWACPGPLFGEAATLALTLVSAPRCVTIGYDLTISAVCTHTLTNANWGSSSLPCTTRLWSAVDYPTPGRPDYNGDTTPTYLKENATYDFDDGVTAYVADGSREWFPKGGQNIKALYLEDHASVGTLFRSSNAGAVTATTRSLAETDATLDSSLSITSQDYPLTDPAGALALLATARAAGTGFISAGSEAQGIGYGATEPTGQFTFKIRANNPNYDFSDPGFNSTKTYQIVGTELPAEPFAPIDWTEVADTGFAFQQVSTFTQANAFQSPYMTANVLGAAGIMIGEDGIGNTIQFYAWESTVDASNSATGTPYPFRVEIRLTEWEDFATISVGAWTDISDTVYAINAPTSLGGASIQKYTSAEYRFTPLFNSGGSCNPLASPTFICHPGLTC